MLMRGPLYYEKNFTRCTTERDTRDANQYTFCLINIFPWKNAGEKNQYQHYLNIDLSIFLLEPKIR